RAGAGDVVLAARTEEPRHVVQGRVLVGSHPGAGRPRRHDVAAARPRRPPGLLAPSALGRAWQRRALLGGREVPRAGLQGDDDDLPRALPVAAGHPALRGLRLAEVRRVHAESEPAVRDPALQLQVQARLAWRSGRARRGPGPAEPMRGVLGFLAPKLLRALIAVWLVTTVVFVVMRLSGDPVP